MDDLRYRWADYLYQQQRIKLWIPIIIGARIIAVDNGLCFRAILGVADRKNGAVFFKLKHYRDRQTVSQ